MKISQKSKHRYCKNYCQQQRSFRICRRLFILIMDVILTSENSVLLILILHDFTCLDVCEIHIGDNVMIGPNVTLATPMHPLLPEERNVRKREDGSFYNLEYAKPITIKDNCWLASNVVVCGGVTIGEGCVIGAGSVVTRDIPPYSLAAGNPCRVIRKITEKDHMPDGIEKN